MSLTAAEVKNEEMPQKSEPVKPTYKQLSMKAALKIGSSQKSIYKKMSEIDTRSISLFYIDIRKIIYWDYLPNTFLMIIAITCVMPQWLLREPTALPIAAMSLLTASA